MSILKILTDLCAIKQKTKNKKHFCKYCLQCFSSKRNLIEQKETCLKINGKLTVTFFFSMWVFFHKHSRITGLQGKGEGVSLTPHYHFHPLHTHLDISREITAESSPLHIASSRTRTGNLWFPSASR